ncbi:MAG: NAD(P)-dependent oxidoreductase [Nitrososphaerales archaeon]
MSNKILTIGFIGLGAMGKPLLRSIMKGGFKVVVWNRTPEKCREFVAAGAYAAKSPREVAERCDIIFSMLAKPHDTLGVLCGEAEDYRDTSVISGASSGKVVVDMSTNSPFVTRKIGTIMKERGIGFLDSPVLGNPTVAEKAALSIIVSGEDKYIDMIEPVLKTMGKHIFRVGVLGSAATMKLALNYHLMMINLVFAESFSFATKLGVEPERSLEIWNASINKTYVSENYGPKIMEGTFSEARFTLELAHKDLVLAQDIAKEVKFPLLLGGIGREAYTACLAKGWDSLDVSAVVKLYEDINGIKVSGRAKEQVEK